MNLKFGDKVDVDLKEFSEDVRIRIYSNIFDLENNPLPDNSYVIRLLDGSEIQCLKLQEEYRNSNLNHRVTYDIKEDKYIRIYGIFDRNPGYKNIKEETKSRM